MGEQKSPKNSHLIIFMRAPLPDVVGVCQVKAVEIQVNKGGTSVHKTFREIKLVFKGF